MRARVGGEFRAGHFSALAESEATLAIVDDYNAFPFATSSRQTRPGYATIPDPQTIELNRLQLQYRADNLAVTIGRQRINLDDQRWVGAAGMRQNEQTFDAVRGEVKAGPLQLDASYVISQRTVFGVDAGPRQAFDGKFWLLGAAAPIGPIKLKAFAYLLDYDAAFLAGNSSQTYGARATWALPLAGGVKADLAASYARQSAYGRNPVSYAADYIAADAALALRDLTISGGFEQLGADASAGRAVQTPMATAHKFNGWADLFTTTPDTGLRDWHAGASYRFANVTAIPGLQAGVSWRRFTSAVAGRNYGQEWDANLGFQVRGVGILARFADYRAHDFGANTRKFWLQADFRY